MNILRGQRQHISAQSYVTIGVGVGGAVAESSYTAACTVRLLVIHRMNPFILVPQKCLAHLRRSVYNVASKIVVLSE
jgi:cobyric acid synthase